MNASLIDNIRTFFVRLKDGALDALSVTTIMLDGFFEVLDGLRIVSSKYAWCITPSFEFFAIVSIAAATKETNRPQHVIYQLIRDYFRDNNWTRLSQMVDQMGEYSVVRGQRHKIIRDSLQALKWHTYKGFNGANLIIPTLFTQIDGILGNFARDNKIPNWTDRKKDGPEKLRSEFKRVTYSFDEPALDLIFDVLFSASYAGEVGNGRRLNRNKILHGQWLEYGRLEYVLRSLLVIDFLGYVIEEHRSRKMSNDWNIPHTEKSKFSKILSENFVSGMAPLARKRLAKYIPIHNATHITGATTMNETIDF